MYELKDQVSTKISKREADEVARLVKSGLFINTSDFVRDSIRRRLQELGKASIDSPGIVRERVYEYFKRRGGSGWPDEAATELGYSVLEVLGALRELEKQGKAAESPGEVEGGRKG